MDLILFEELDSTSTQAQEMLRSGRNAPFAVQALSQTGGRGRRGRRWESPAGNLYLTIVYPGTVEFHCEWCQKIGPRLSALRVAWILAQMIEKKTHLRLTIKWPNDLYLYGAKLGGILIESSVSRQADGVQWGPHVIGIGLNLNQAPAGLDGAAVLGHYTADTDPVLWGELIASEFSSLVEKTPSCQLVEAMERYLISPLHPWMERKSPDSQDPQGEAPLESHPSPLSPQEGFQGPLFFQKKIEKEGTLILEKSTLTGEILELSSSHHDCFWAYSYRDQHKSGKEPPMVVADIGNSRIKVALFKPFDALEPASVWDTVQVDDPKFCHHMKELRKSLDPSSGYWPLHVLSVHPTKQKSFFDLCESLGFKPLAIQKRTTLLHPRRDAEPYPLSQLGIDRLAAMEGFLAALSPQIRRENRLGIIVSLGTASTIDFVTTQGDHLGGVILPGLELSLKALHQETGLLPHVKPEAESLGLGSNTVSAMSHGVLAMTLGAVVELRRRLGETQPLWKEMGPDLYWMTGGLASRLAAHGAQFHVRPHLVLLGGRQMVLSGG